jgi:hypothetical protein
MKRIDTATKAADLFGPGKHGFKAGNVLAGEAPTKLSAGWFNALQEEVARAIEAFGLELDPEDNGQLAAALTALLAQVALLAPKDSPIFTGTPEAPTAALGTNTDQIATMAAVKQAIDALVAGAPGALDTLVELSNALGNDADFATTVTNAIAAKVAKAGDTMTGELVIALAALQLTLRNSNNTAATVVDHQRFLRGSGSGVRAAWQSIRGASNALGDLYLTFLSAADAVLHRYTFGADGKLLLPADPTDDLGAATKQYVDARAGAGWEQTWQNVTATRAGGVTYTNTTGKPIVVAVTLTNNSPKKTFQVNGGEGFVDVGTTTGTTEAWNNTISAIIPPGHDYRVDVGPIILWSELR